MQRCHGIEELCGEPATVGDNEKLDGSDQDKNLEIHVGRNSRIMNSFWGIQGLARAAQTSVCEHIMGPGVF